MSGKVAPSKGVEYQPVPAQLQEASPSRPTFEARPSVLQEEIWVDNHKQIPDTAKKICTQWIRRPPDLIVSFLTNEEDNGAFANLIQRNAFQEGINQMVQKLPEVLFFDNGSPRGLSSLLGNTLRGLDFFHDLVEQNKSARPLEFEANAISRLIAFTSQTPARSHGISAADPNHMRLVIVDGPSEDQNLKMRAELELAVWKELTEYSQWITADDEIQRQELQPIHFAVVLISGSVEELSAIAMYLRHRIPIVVLEGAGGVADILSFGLRQSPMISPQQRRKELINKIQDVFPAYARDANLVRIAVDLHLAVLKLASIEELSLIEVISPKQLAHLDALIVDALVGASVSSANQRTFNSNLILGIRANRPGIIGKVLFGSPVWENMEIPYHAVEESLVLHGRAAFLDVFLQQGLPVHKHLDAERYLRLYQRAANEEFFREIIWTSLLNHSHNDPVTERFITVELNSLLYELTDVKNFIDVDVLVGIGLNHDQSTYPEAIAERMALNALAVFGALMGDEFLVQLVIKHSPEPIPLALFMEAVFRGIGRRINVTAFTLQLQRYAGNLSQTVVGLYDMALQESQKRAHDLLIRELPLFNNRNVLRLAYDAKDRNFIAMPAVQEFLDKWYYGFIDVKGSFNVVKLLTSAVFIFPINKYLRFPTLEHQTERPRPTVEGRLYPRPQTQGEADEYLAHIGQAADPLPHTERVPLSKKLYTVWNAPAVAFHTSQITYWLFLILLATTAMMPPCKYIGWDIAVFVMAGLRFLELCTKALYDMKALPIISFKWIALELFAEGMFTSMFFLYRIYPFRYAYPFYGRVVISLGVFYYHYRVWDLFYYMDGILGPTIRMTIRSFRFDLVKWLLVTYNIFIGTGLVWQAIVFPDFPSGTGEDWRKAAFRSLSSILYSAPFYELEFSSYCESQRIDTSLVQQPLKYYVNTTTAIPAERCWIGNYADYNCNTITIWAYIFHLVYYLFVLLGTLLMLASWIFTRFIDEWAENAAIWKFHRCRLIMNYAIRTSLPAPFSILGYIYNIFKKQGVRYVDNQPKTGLKPLTEADPLLTSPETPTTLTTAPVGIDTIFWKNLSQMYHRRLADEAERKDLANQHDAVITNVESDLSTLVKVTDHLQSLLSTANISFTPSERKLPEDANGTRDFNMPRVFSDSDTGDYTHHDINE